MPQNSLAGLVLVMGTNVRSLVVLLVSTPPKVSWPFVASSSVVGAKNTPTIGLGIRP